MTLLGSTALTAGLLVVGVSMIGVAVVIWAILHSPEAS